MVNKRIELVKGAVKISVVEADVERFLKLGYAEPKTLRRRKPKAEAETEGGE